MIDADDNVAIADAGSADKTLRCPKCGKQVKSLRCGHCGSQLPDWQADLYGATIRQLAKLGGSRADDGSQGGEQETAQEDSQRDGDQPKDNGGASTPDWLFDRCNELAIQACGEPISLDVAAADWNHKCARYFTEDDDGLKQVWDAKAVWCNPPYSATIIERFVRRAIDAVHSGTTTICLLPWWNYPYLDLCEQYGRLHRIPSPVTFRREDGSTLTLNNGFRSTPLVVVALGPTIRPGFGAPIRKSPSSGAGQDTPTEEITFDDHGTEPDLSEEKAVRTLAVPRLADEERRRREDRTSLIHGDAVAMLKTVPDGTADLCLFDPPYPNIKRPYGTLTEDEWHDLMRAVLQECKRILKPNGSVVVVIQPNYETIGRMRLWPWKFASWAAEMWSEWGLVEDVYSFAPNALPSAGTERQHGLLRKSIKWCVWLGPADCYRNQDAVLAKAAEYTVARQNRTDDRSANYPGGFFISRASFRRTMEERGGVTPHNLLVPFPVSNFLVF